MTQVSSDNQALEPSRDGEFSVGKCDELGVGLSVCKGVVGHGREGEQLHLWAWNSEGGSSEIWNPSLNASDSHRAERRQCSTSLSACAPTGTKRA
jgi:hypothetical protein